MSVSVKVRAKLPFATGPLCDARSASICPGAGSPQSSNVLIGTLRLSGAPDNPGDDEVIRLNRI
jgi:hypothetical protein